MTSGPYTPVLEFLQRTDNPRLRLHLRTGEPFALSIYGDMSRYADQVRLNGGKRDSPWYGRIDHTGHWRPSANLSREITGAIVDLLDRLAADSTATVAEHGRRTGICCFCMRDLTDPVSVQAGYGPVCAERYGLPHASAPAPTTLELFL